MSDKPFTFTLPGTGEIRPSRCDNHIERCLTSMRGMFQDERAYEAMLAVEDKLLYEVFEIRRPEVAGELISGISVVHPGLVGNEYYMTKGHFHSVLDTAEIYYCISGDGCMVMETPEGECDVEWFHPGTVLYVAPRWAHRSVNTDLNHDLVTYFVYSGNAGHDYKTIETYGFHQIVVHSDKRPVVQENPRWKSAGGEM